MITTELLGHPILQNGQIVTSERLIDNILIKFQIQYLEYVNNELSPILAKIINICVDQGYFPTE